MKILIFHKVHEAMYYLSLLYLSLSMLIYKIHTVFMNHDLIDLRKKTNDNYFIKIINLN